jgi:hypothetical protein
MSYDDALTEALRCALQEDVPEAECQETVLRRAALLAGLGSDDGDD